jgi:mRNA-degrading endonuclease RelE of RelBE toxin-antitoxin system
VAPYELRLTPSSERSLIVLPESAAAAIVEFLTGALLAEPHRVGKPLMRELSGYLAARRGPYRVIYRVDDERKTVSVLRIDHRADVYRR